MAHETLDAVLPAVARIAHARTDNGLQVEGQPLLGASGDVVQMETNGPKKLPRPPGVPRFRAATASPPTSASSPMVWVSYT